MHNCIGCYSYDIVAVTMTSRVSVNGHNTRLLAVTVTYAQIPSEPNQPLRSAGLRAADPAAVEMKGKISDQQKPMEKWPDQRERAIILVMSPSPRCFVRVTLFLHHTSSCRTSLQSV